MKTTKAFHIIDAGRVKATIWHENDSEKKTQFNIAFTKLCRDDERWWDSTCFRIDDMPALATLAKDVHTWITLQSQSQSQIDGDESAEGTS